MTGRYVALLRGINVGRAKRVAMADLRAVVEDLGYADVRTLLNSGNVVFTAPGSSAGDAAGRIGAALEAQLGISSRIVVLAARDLAADRRRQPPARGRRRPVAAARRLPRRPRRPPEAGAARGARLGAGVCWHSATRQPTSGARPA